MANEPQQSEVDEVWRAFWEPLLTTNGELDLEKVKNELYDYHVVIEEVTAVYDELTNGRFTKPNTARQYIIQAVQDLQD